MGPLPSFLGRGLDAVHLADELERLRGADVTALERADEIAAGVHHAADLDGIAQREDALIAPVAIDLHPSFAAAEQLERLYRGTSSPCTDKRHSDGRRPAPRCGHS